MWIMDDSTLNLAGGPIPGGLTLGTPHLAASAGFHGRHRAFRARFGLAFDHLEIGRDVFVADVIFFGIFDDTTVFARDDRTRSTDHLGIHESAAFFDGTRCDKFETLTFRAFLFGDIAAISIPF